MHSETAVINFKLLCVSVAVPGCRVSVGSGSRGSISATALPVHISSISQLKSETQSVCASGAP